MIGLASAATLAGALYATPASAASGGGCNNVVQNGARFQTCISVVGTSIVATASVTNGASPMQVCLTINADSSITCTTIVGGTGTFKKSVPLASGTYVAYGSFAWAAQRLSMESPVLTV